MSREVYSRARKAKRSTKHECAFYPVSLERRLGGRGTANVNTVTSSEKPISAFMTGLESQMEIENVSQSACQGRRHWEDFRRQLSG